MTNDQQVMLIGFSVAAALFLAMFLALLGVGGDIELNRQKLEMVEDQRRDIADLADTMSALAAQPITITVTQSDVVKALKNLEETLLTQFYYLRMEVGSE